EGEVGIRAQPVLGIGEELHVAIELPSAIDSDPRNEAQGIERSQSRDESRLRGNDGVPIAWRAGRSVNSAEKERPVTELESRRFASAKNEKCRLRRRDLR